MAEHILCERYPPYQICLQAGCSYFDLHLLADLLSAVLRDHLDPKDSSLMKRVTSTRFTSKKVWSWTSVCRPFSLPRMEVHVQKVSNQAAGLRNNGRSCHLCVAVSVCASSWQHPLESDLALDEGGGGLVVDRGERGDVADELVEQSGLQQVCFFGDQRLLSEHHVLGSGWVCGEESPVDEASVPVEFVLHNVTG